MADAKRDYVGVLCIGDPHLCSRVPGFRKDDYPNVILKKLRWALEYARTEKLLPVLLGDLFHFPRDNANWLLVELIDVFRDPVCVIAGNHDCSENELSRDDTLSVLIAAQRLRLLDAEPWAGTINGQRVHVGGTTWGVALPETVDRGMLGDPEFVFWVSHHDVSFPGYESGGRFGCREIPGVDLVVNGHIHRSMPDVIAGVTTWCNPGNIARVNRGDATRAHVPGVLRIDVAAGGWTKTRVPVPCEAFENVFHEQVRADATEPTEGSGGESPFITGLASLQQFKTAGGEGLKEFLDRNLPQFPDERVRQEVLLLAEEVLNG